RTQPRDLKVLLLRILRALIIKSPSLVNTRQENSGSVFIGPGATPWESNRDLSQMDNRFSTMTEVRRTAWPFYEKPEWSERMFLQGIAGTLELFHLSIVRFQNVVGEATGHPVMDYQRRSEERRVGKECRC